MKLLFYLLILLLPVQLGRHFWPFFSFIQGIRVDYLSPTIYLTDILILLLLIFDLFGSVRKFSCSAAKILHLPSLKMNLFGGLFMILVIIGIYYSRSPLAGLYGLVKILEFIFLGFYIAKTVKTKKEVSRIVSLLTVGLVFESFLAIWQFLNQSSVGGFFWLFGERTFIGQTVGVAQAVLNGTLILRPYGTFSHPNVLAGFLVVVMSLVSLKLKVKSSKFEKIFFGAALALGTATVFLTLSRVAILLWLLILGFYLGWYFLKLKPFSGKFIIYKLSFIIFLIFIFSRFNFSLTEESFTRREELAAASIEMFKNHSFFGVGLNNFLVNLPFIQKTQSTILYLQPVHNVYLLILAETGILGLSVFIWFLIKTLQKLNPSTLLRVDGEKSRTIKNQLLVPLLAILVLGLFDHYFLTLQQGQLLFTLILGLSWSRIKE